MRVDVVTLFPELFETFLETGMVGRAIHSGALVVKRRHLREHGIGKHRSVDDTPYGGGSGMVMRVDCLVACLESIDADPPPPDLGISLARAHRVLLTPQGVRLHQANIAELSTRPWIAIVCGRYEGFDERVRSFVDEELSLGDFVLAGGEIPAMAILDACSRLLPGVLGNAESSQHESHSAAMEGRLEYPQYTRPAEFRGLGVPQVLQGGNHAAITAFRREESMRRTAARRPDLASPSSQDAPSHDPPELSRR